jgi:SmpA / OmlA family
MSASRGFTNQVLRVVAFGLLPLVVSLSSHAQDAARVDQLEKEIQTIKQRLSKIESAQGNADIDQKPVIQAEGWKSLSAWRQLKSGMSPNEVRAILGEPSRVNGGETAFWYYANGGVSTFMSEKLYRWKEPN